MNTEEEVFTFDGDITDYWTYTQLRDYLLLMPGLTHLALRMYEILRSMIAETKRNRPGSRLRRMTIDQLCYLLSTDVGKPISVSTMYEVLGVLKRLDLVVPRDSQETEGASQLKGKTKAVHGILRGFTVRDLPPATYTGWRNAWDKLDAYRPEWREAPIQPPTHTTSVTVDTEGHRLARVRRVGSVIALFQDSGTVVGGSDQGDPSFQDSGTAFQDSGTAFQDPGTVSPVTSGNGLLKEVSPTSLSKKVDAQARSGGDGRRPSAGSTRARGEGGSAASGKTSPSPTPKNTTRGPAVGKTKSGSKKAAHSREQLDTVRRVRAFFPPELLDHGLPELPVVSSAILTAMGEGRTVEQMRDRIWFRWANHGFSDIWAEEKAFNSPVGVAVALVRPLRRGDRFACPDLRCENGASLDTGEPCRLCAERLADWRAERARKRAQMPRQGANPGPVGAGSADTSLPPQRAAQDVPAARDDVAELNGVADVATEGLPWWEVEAARYEQTLAGREQQDAQPSPAPF
ncbi:hypothetical protein pZL12.82 [Streptomyces phage ZL12]|uniref:Uncharacterized protein n=1 Tax=Streptomyces phage ZL12 TaxID=2570911 RepID=D0UWI7_9CAUD|nr:hypothetical protein QEH43_gp082 [Streptomyces phage ZL12]ACX71159.1 hypothetical protein pZL12.82 [Streptomyces phage ZL12]